MPLVKGLKVNPEACLAACSPEIFSAWQAIESAKKGMPFRTAYQETAKKLLEGKSMPFPAFSELLDGKPLGPPAALGLPKLQARIAAHTAAFKKKSHAFSTAMKKLWGKTHAGP